MDDKSDKIEDKNFGYELFGLDKLQIFESSDKLSASAPWNVKNWKEKHWEKIGKEMKYGPLLSDDDKNDLIKVLKSENTRFFVGTFEELLDSDIHFRGDGNM